MEKVNDKLDETIEISQHILNSLETDYESLSRGHSNINQLIENSKLIKRNLRTMSSTLWGWYYYIMDAVFFLEKYSTEKGIDMLPDIETKEKNTKSLTLLKIEQLEKMASIINKNLDKQNNQLDSLTDKLEVEDDNMKSNRNRINKL